MTPLARLRRAVVNGLAEILAHRLRSVVSVAGVMLAVATFAVIVQLGDAGRSGIVEVVERTQGRPATYAIDVPGPASVRELELLLATASGPPALRIDVAPFFTLGELDLDVAAGQPLPVTLVATDRRILSVLPRPLLGGQWWDARRDRIDLPLILPEPVAAEIASATGGTADELVGVALAIAGQDMSVRVAGIAPRSALERFAGTGGFALLPMASVDALPLELVRPASVSRMLLVADPASGRRLAGVAAARVVRAAEIRGEASPAVEVARVDEAGAFAGATRALDAILRGIAAIALAVGALGIANISMTSLGARVGEFGLRRAVGASPADIFAMVATESALLGLAGGVAGVVVAAAASSFAGPVVASALDIPFGPTRPAIAATGVLASLAAGLAAGLVPATVAHRMSVLDALRSS